MSFYFTFKDFVRYNNYILFNEFKVSLDVLFITSNDILDEEDNDAIR